MNKLKRSIALLISSLLVFTFIACTQNGSIQNDNIETENRITSIEELQNIDNFRNGALEHILEGEVNKRGKAVGYHYEGLDNTAGEVVEGTRSKPNEDGVYTAKVKVDGIEKTSNGGRSSFFPEDWSVQDVVDNINEAYDNKVFVTGSDNTYRGECDEGVEIEMYIDNAGKIISAFPIY